MRWRSGMRRIPPVSDLSIWLLDVVPGADDGIEIRVGQGQREWVLTLPASQRAERASLVALASASETGASSYIAVGSDTRARANHRHFESWERVRIWDFEHVVQPLYAMVVGEGRAPGLMLFPGQSKLAGFSLRMALRSAIRRGACDPDATLRLQAIPLWAGDGARRLERLARSDALPRVTLGHVRFVLAPVPSGLERVIGAFMRRTPQPEVFKRHFGAQLRPDLQSYIWTHKLRKALVSNARAFGSEVLDEPNCDQFLSALAGGQPHETLVVVAHQTKDGIHLRDGALPLRAVQGHLGARLRHRPQGLDNSVVPRDCYGSVDIAVCHSQEPGNLAECMNAFGVPVVMAQGHRAYYGVTCGTWLMALDVLQRCRPMVLHRLVERVWRYSQGRWTPPEVGTTRPGLIGK